MEVEFAFLADAADAPLGGKLYVLGAGINELGAAKFPTAHPTLVLVLKLRLHAAECERSHRLEIQFWDADGTRLPPEMSAEFTAAQHPRYKTRDVFVQMVLNIIGLPLPAPGEYDFHIVVDDRHLKTLPLYVQLGPPQTIGEPPEPEPS